MAEDRRFIIEIRSKGFQKAQRGLIEIKRNTDKLAQSTEHAKNQTRRYKHEQKNATGAGAAFRRETSALRNNILLYTFAIGGTVAAIGNLVRSFADAQDTTNRFRSVFKEFSDEAENFSENFGQRFGFARTEVMKMMETFQGLFVPLGFSREAAVGLSQAMVKLSMDVGSFRAVNPTQVAQMFTSALIGNHEAVRRLNIALTENSVKTAAVSNGFATSKTTVTDQQKVLGRFVEILRQTTDAQGDMSRTMDDFNNRTRRVQQQIIELRQELGEAILPIAELGLKFAEVAFKSEILAFSFGSALVVFAAFKTALGLVTIATVGLRAALIGTSGPLGVIVTLAGLVGAGVGHLVNKQRELRTATQKSAESLQNQGRFVAEFDEEIKKLNITTQKSLNRFSDLQEDFERTGRAAETNTQKLIRYQKMVAQLSNELNVATENLKREDSIRKKADQQLKTRVERLTIQLLTMRDLNILEKTKIESQIKGIAISETELKLLQAIVDKEKEIENIEIRKRAEQRAKEQIEKRKILIEDNIRDSTLAAKKELAALRQENINFENDIRDSVLKAQEELNNLDTKTKKSMVDITENANFMASSILAVASAFKTMGDASMSESQKMRVMFQTMGSIMMMIPGMQIPGAAVQAASMFIGHKGGLVKNNGIQKFAHGGMVQGQDNVPIMAQAGEFIMRRSAVENIGVNNLAQMNRTGSSGANVTVNIQGGVVQEDYVRNTLIPALNKATSQGSRINA